LLYDREIDGRWVKTTAKLEDFAVTGPPPHLAENKPGIGDCLGALRKKGGNEGSRRARSRRQFRWLHSLTPVRRKDSGSRSDAWLFRDHSSRRGACRLFRRREHEADPHVPAVGPVLRGKFFVAFDIKVTLSRGAQGNNEPDLRANANHLGLEATDPIARAAVATDLLIHVAHKSDLKLLGQELRRAPIEMHVDAVLILGRLVGEIVGEAEHSREFVPGLRIEISVAAASVDRPVPDANIRQARRADVAGYSRLMGADEEGTLAQLKAHRRALVDPKIAEHRGRIVKTTGDGMLVEFASVVDAVRCAIELQRGMAERNAEVPQEKRIEFRVGIHQGDIVVEDQDIFGDGVNVAARLESLAEPGGICVSGRVQEDARGKLDIAFEDAGDQQLKNIERPVRIYRVLSNAAAGSSRPALPLPGKPSIAVLPFQNMSGDPEQEYFADGMVEEIITALSRFRQLFVIARNSTFTYKGQAADVKQVSRELGGCAMCWKVRCARAAIGCALPRN
jgi:class 3 adenylate cyclase